MVNRDYLRIWVSDIAPHPSMNVLWMDLATNQYGSTIKYWDGTRYVNLFPDVQYLTDTFMEKSIYDANNNGIVDKATGDANGDRIDLTYLKVDDYIPGAPQLWEPDTEPDWIKPSDGKVVDASHIVNLPEQGVLGPNVSEINNIAIFDSIDGSSITDSNINIEELVRKSIHVTYNELVDLINNSLLVPVQTYLLTDYRTTYSDGNVTLGRSASDLFYGILQDDEVVCPVEPLLLTASTRNTLKVEAYSPIHTHDIVYYTIDNSNDSTRGLIYRRIDTLRNNDIQGDWRELKYPFRRINSSNIPSYSSIPTNTNFTQGQLFYLYGTLHYVINDFNSNEPNLLIYTYCINTQFTPNTYIWDINGFDIPTLSDKIYYKLIEDYENKPLIRNNRIGSQSHSIIKYSDFHDNEINELKYSMLMSVISESFFNNKIGILYQATLLNSVSYNKIDQIDKVGIGYLVSNYVRFIFSSVISILDSSNISGDIVNVRITQFRNVESSFISECNMNDLSYCNIIPLGMVSVTAKNIDSCSLRGISNIKCNSIISVGGDGILFNSNNQFTDMENCSINGVISAIHSLVKIKNVTFQGNMVGIYLYDFADQMSSDINLLVEAVSRDGNKIVSYKDELGDTVITVTNS
jgi:hypothetical protein